MSLSGLLQIKWLVFTAITFFFLYFGFWWIYRLEVLPGLHADEAWSALKAVHFKNINKTDQLSGMNYYTGILQVLIAELGFNSFGTGVFQLRIGGVMLNLFGLLLICRGLLKETNCKVMLIFLLIMAQSALYLISPRVAWEVNSLTLFFFSLLFISFIKIRKAPRNGSFWHILFLLTNILGTYNHVIFSCISVSALAGLSLWMIFYHSNKHRKIMLLLVVNLFNLIIVFLSMRYLMGSALRFLPHTVIFIVVALLAELILYDKLISIKPVWRLKARLSRIFIKGILVLAIVSFLGFHGIAFLQTLSNYKLVLHAYSREYPVVVQLMFFICGCNLLYYFALCLWKNLNQPASSVFVFMLVAYMGILNFYTVDTSFRYYLVIYLAAGLFVAYNAGTGQQTPKKLIIGLVTGFILLNSMLLDIFFFATKPVRAVEFNVGNGKIETSAHFLPKQPLIDFLRKNEIGEIRYLEKDFYFIEEPVKFYKLIEPWKENPQNKAIIDFDFQGYKNGFMLYKEP